MAGSVKKWTMSAGVCVLLILGMPLCADELPHPTGYVYRQFSLGNSGYDTAGGNDPNENYFHTANGIEQRDSSGGLVKTILLPSDQIYGVASDGTKLFCSEGGSKIYGHLTGNLWGGGLDTHESGARGLAVTPNYFALIVRDGTEIALINKITGHTEHRLDISTIAQEGFGLDYCPDSDELILTNGTADIFLLKLSTDYHSFASWNKVTASGLGATNLIGIGYNSQSKSLILDEGFGTGQYATGPEHTHTLAADLNKDGRVDLVDFAMVADEWLTTYNVNPVFGKVTKQFALGNSGYDTAGGNDPNENYFHTANGIEQRDSSGGLVKTILLPSDQIYGVASDGTKLFCSEGGSKIYGHLSGNLWDLGLDIHESGARGLAATTNYFGLITDNGANLAIIDRINGNTLHKMDISAILGEGLGLDYIPATNEFIATNGTDAIYRLKLTPDFSAIQNWSSVTATGLGANTLLGIGYNMSSGNLVLNDQESVGKYAEGIPEPISADITKDGIVDFKDLGELASQWLSMESWLY